MDKSDELLNKLTLPEKAKLFVGKNGWELEAIEGKNIFLSDGPHGIRKEVTENGKKSTVKAVCYPAACLSACSFDRELFHEFGQELAKECIQNDIDVLLGPGTNIKRNPLCGRNFEYFSEDPFLSGKLSASYIEGVQSKHIGVSLKHFALNSQEYARFINDSIADERAMREIYLKAFEIAIKESAPWTIMASYNKINGTHATENRHLLTDICREEFGFDGVIMSDWGALHNSVDSLAAGLDLEMPGLSKGSEARILKAIEDHLLEESTLNASTKRLIDLYLKTQQPKKKEFDPDHALQVAKKINDESIVLLKNDDHILPLKKQQDLALIGDFCTNPRYQGSGSSQINPIYVGTLLEAFEKEGLSFTFARGYDAEETKPSEKLIAEAVQTAKGKDAVVIMCGLPRVLESEGYDRDHLDMPKSQLELIRRVSEVNPNTVIVLQNGAPIKMPFLGSVRAVMETYLGGSMHAESIKDVLLGTVNPSGRLAETFPLRYEDVPSAPYYGKDMHYSLYKESIYVGYRYYDTFQKPVLFPFGYGLCYSDVRYSDFQVQVLGDEITATFTLKNCSDLAVKEVVQLYAGQPESKLLSPKKELKAFDKIDLLPGETKQVTLNLRKEDLRHYSLSHNQWQLEGGVYRFYLAKHAMDDSLYADVYIESEDEISESVPAIYRSMDWEITDAEFFRLLGRTPELSAPKKPFTKESPVCDFSGSILGFFVFKAVTLGVVMSTKDKLERKIFRKAMPTQPVRSVQMMMPLSKTSIDGIVDIFNGHPIVGFQKLFAKQEKL